MLSRDWSILHEVLMRVFISLMAHYWSVFEAGVGLRLNASFAALICFAVLGIFRSLPATVCSLFSPYFKLMHVAPLKLLAAHYWSVIEAGVGLRLDAPFAALICFAALTQKGLYLRRPVVG